MLVKIHFIIQKSSMSNRLFLAGYRQLYKSFFFSDLCFPKCQRTQKYSKNLHKDDYKKVSNSFFSFPTTSFSSHFSFLLLKIIKLSCSTSIIFLAFCCNSFNFTSEISPSNTEFCIQLRYCRHNFSILPTRFWPIS